MEKRKGGGTPGNRKTSATALPIPLTIAAALLGLVNDGICNVLVPLCGLGGGGGSLGGASLSKAEGIVGEQFLRFFCVLSLTVHFLRYMGGCKNEQKVLI